MRNLFLSGTLLAALVFPFGPVKAHSRCAMPVFAVEYDNSSAVFVGEVIEAEKKGDNRVFVFEVALFWKGIESRRITVYVTESPRYQALFEENKTYLVFAKSDDDGQFFDGRCSRSTEIGGYSSTLKYDLEELGKPKTCIELKDSEKNEKQ